MTPQEHLQAQIAAARRGGYEPYDQPLVNAAVAWAETIQLPGEVPALVVNFVSGTTLLTHVHELYRLRTTGLGSPRCRAANDYYTGNAALWAAVVAAKQARSPSSKARVDALAAAARAFIAKRGIDVTKPWPNPLRIYAAELAASAGCHPQTAKRHLANAARLLRGEAVKERGGKRDGAGRPAAVVNDE